MTSDAQNGQKFSIYIDVYVCDTHIDTHTPRHVLSVVGGADFVLFCLFSCLVAPQVSPQFALFVLFICHCCACCCCYDCYAYCSAVVVVVVMLSVTHANAQQQQQPETTNIIYLPLRVLSRSSAVSATVSPAVSSAVSSICLCICISMCCE